MIAEDAQPAGADPAFYSLRRRFGRQGFAYALAEGGSKGLTYLLFIVLAARMPVADFGYLNLFITVAGLLGVLVGLGLPDATLRFYFRGEPSLPAILGTVLIWIGVATAVTTVVVGGAAKSLAQALDVPLLLVGLALLAAPTIALRQVWFAVLRAAQRTRVFVAARLAEPVLMAGFLLGMLVAGRSLGYRDALWAYVASVAAVGATGLVSLLRTGVRVTLAPSRELLTYSRPLIFHALAMTGIATFDQVVINQLLGADATGVYAFVYRFGMAMSLVYFAIAAAWAPLALERLEQDPAAPALGPLAVMAVRIAIVAAAVLAFVLPPLAGWIGGPRYASAVRLIPVVIYGYLWATLYSVAVVHLIQARRSLGVALASGFTFLFNIGSSYVAVSRFGLAGAAVITVASYALLFGMVRLQVGRQPTAVPHDRLAIEVLLSAALVLFPAWFWA